MDWKKWGTLGGVLVLTFLVAEWFYHGNLTEWYIAYMRWLGVPFLVFFPMLILVVGKAKRKRTVVNGLVLVLCFAGTMQLTGCGATELEDRCFPMMAAVDKDNTQILFSYGFPELSQKDNTDLAEAKVSAAMGTGANFPEALHKYEEQLSKAADCNHMKVLVVGQKLAEDEAHFTELLSYLREKELYPRNTYVCFTDTADDLYAIEKNLPEDLGSYIEAYLQNHETEKQIRLLNLGILLDEQLNQRQVLQFPYLKKCLELSNMDSLIVGNTYLEVRMRKHNGKKIIGAILLLGILVLAGNGKMQQAKADPLQPEIARKILRFHILANSDSEEDQAVKIKVRDAIGKMMGPKLADSKNLEETKKIVSENMNDIVALAEKTLEDNGYTYGAAAELAHVQFPEKNYGDYTFPAGEYEALEVTLGKGGGHNWWCVLYPNMCFQGAVYEVVDEEADEALREVLTPEEYADVFDSGKLEIRFKFLEYFR